MEAVPKHPEECLENRPCNHRPNRVHLRRVDNQNLNSQNSINVLGDVTVFCMAPVINDVCTNLTNPPSFVKAKIGPLPNSFKQIIRDSYPELQTKVYPSLDKSTLYSKALDLAKRQTRWTLTYESEMEGVIEGYATTLILRFKDDFVVRVQDGEASGSEVDMRSKSRVGLSDLGVNAKRINDYFADLDNEIQTLHQNTKT